eukprot:SAG31_NODE_18835_length_621_cov_0.869732_1_plen_37_part_01
MQIHDRMHAVVWACTPQYGVPTDKVCKETAPSVFTRE